MSTSFLRLAAAALFVAGVIAPVVARSAAPACTVPERIHISSLIFGYGDDMNPVIERLKHESFDAVAASLPDNYSKDVGWFQRSQLSGSQYQNAAELPAGQYAVFDSQTMGRNITRVDEVRPQATCDDAIRTYPTDPWALSYQAAYEVRAGKTEAAIADYSQQIASDPKASGAYYGRAEIYYSQRLYRKALDDVNHAVMQQWGQAYVLRSDIEGLMGDADLAEADASRGYDQLHGQSQDESPAFIAWGMAYADLGYYKSAIDEYTKALVRHPEDGFTLEARGYVRFAAGDDAAAKADFIHAARVGGASNVPFLDLATVYFVEHDLTKAREFAARAHTLAPNDPYASLWLAITDGHPREYTPPSNSELEPELDEATRSCETTFYRGIVYYEHRQPAQALPLLRAAAGTCPYREHERAVAAHLIRQ